MSYDVQKTHCKTLKLLKNNSNYFLKLIIPGWVGVHVSPSLRMTSFTELNLILHHFSMLRKLISALFIINTAIISTLSLCTRGWPLFFVYHQRQIFQMVEEQCSNNEYLILHWKQRFGGAEKMYCKSTCKNLRLLMILLMLNQIRCKGITRLLCNNNLTLHTELRAVKRIIIIAVSKRIKSK